MPFYLFNYIVVEPYFDNISWSKDSRFSENMLDWLYEFKSPHIYVECNSVVMF